MAILIFGKLVFIVLLPTALTAPYFDDRTVSTKANISAEDPISSIRNFQKSLAQVPISTDPALAEENHNVTGEATARPPTMTYVTWSSYNPQFEEARMNGTVLHQKLYVGDTIVFLCHPTDPVNGMDIEEYSEIYEVSHEEFWACTLRNKTQKIVTCDVPYETRQAVFRRGDPSGKLYFISTSTGTRKGIENTDGGLCAEKNLRISYTLLENFDRKFEDYLTRELFIVNPDEDRRVTVQPKPFALKKSKNSVAARLGQVAKIGETIDYGVYEGPAMTREEWREAFAVNYKPGQQVSLDDLDPKVRKHIRPVINQISDDQSATADALVQKSSSEGNSTVDAPMEVSQ